MHFSSFLRNSLALIAFVSCCGAQAAPLFRAYLSSSGLDTNPCTLPSPCRLLPAALAAVADGGEIWMLDSANYNGATVNVTKSVSILAVPGAVGSLVAAGGPALLVTTPEVKLGLRNLVFGPFGDGQYGVDMAAGSELTVDGCVFANLPSGGISFNTAGTARIVNTIVRNSGSFGILIGSGATATVANVKVLGSTSYGIYVYGAGTQGANVDVSDSIVTGSSHTGIRAENQGTGTVNVTVNRSTVAQNGQFGIVSMAGAGSANVVVAGSSIVSNGSHGLAKTGADATLTTMGNNVVRLNTVGPTLGAITSAPTM
jgi:hypothetical protein